MAEMSTWIRGVERAGTRVVTITDDDRLRLYRAFVTIIRLTRSIVARWPVGHDLGAVADRPRAGPRQTS
jgi:hypothetical protein